LAAGRKDTILGAVSLSTDFFFYAPEKRHKTAPHTIKPDIDNLVKPVMDTLKSIGVYKDDCQVSAKFTRKYWVNKQEDEGMFIRVSRIV
jgi:Holliday junction resolvase RusA-like endonuclease